MRSWSDAALGAVVLYLCWAAQAMAVEAGLRPAEEYGPLRGPAQARGVIVFSHGKTHLADPYLGLPPYLSRLHKAGWDVWRLVRPYAEDNEETSTNHLIDAGRTLRAQGYAQVAAIGQSMGGWISIRAAMERPEVFDAVLATAPAAFGTWATSTGKISGTNWRDNLNVVNFLADMKAGPRVMVFFFDKDDFDPGGRGEGATKALAARAGMYAVVDRPEGLVGHGASRTRAFDGLFGACIQAFLEAPARPGAFSCPEQSAEMRAQRFDLPGDLHVAGAAPGAPEALSRLPGQWYGFYPNGREVLVTVEETRADGATLVYAWSGLADEKGGWTRVTAQWDGGTLRSANAKRVLSYRPTADGRVAAHWERVDGSQPMDATLERLE
ncbi:MAG TPA: alpha/beta hydrolase-fold protein [Magnetospirillum sp.]|jgi:pimeloyl-ACP methyl ester carboxylesterase|nr:alpha/beta hydrolase-fold protein [Magnetospirillum sp.]